MLRHLLLALALIAPGLSTAQTRFLSSPDEVRKVAEAIVASLGASNSDGAIKQIRPLSVVPPTEFDVFEAQFNNQQLNMLRQFGAPSGYEYVREDKVGTRLVRHQFLVFHEKAPIRWNFVFYKAEKGWVISHFAFDGNAMSFF
jgi:hypothetical protein